MKSRIPLANEPVPPEYVRSLSEIDSLAALLDHQFQIPFTNIRFGWDPVIGLVPIAGDLVALALSIKIIAAARALGAPVPMQRRMLLNAGVDALLGVVPIAGTAFDVYFKANQRNVDLLFAEISRSRRFAENSDTED